MPVRHAQTTLHAYHFACEQLCVFVVFGKVVCATDHFARIPFYAQTILRLCGLWHNTCKQFNYLIYIISWFLQRQCWFTLLYANQFALNHCAIDHFARKPFSEQNTLRFCGLWQSGLRNHFRRRPLCTFVVFKKVVCATTRHRPLCAQTILRADNFVRLWSLGKWSAGPL